MLIAAGQAEAAAATLDDSERHYEQSGAGKDLLTADVRARRAVAHARAGRPVSALSDIDRAIEGYARQGVQLEGPPRSLDLSRVLSLAAVVHRAHGDPDQALACAAQALFRYEEGEAAVNADPAAHLGYAVDMAAGTASVLEAARGNRREAPDLDDLVLSVAEEGWSDLARALARKGAHLLAAGPLPRSLDQVLRTAGAATGQVGVAVLRRIPTAEKSYSALGRTADHASAPPARPAARGDRRRSRPRRRSRRRLADGAGEPPAARRPLPGTRGRPPWSPWDGSRSSTGPRARGRTYGPPCSDWRPSGAGGAGDRGR